MLNKSSMHFDHNERISHLPEDDFFAQVKRTIGGQRISEEQFQIILEDIRKVLKFNKNDVLLDMCCGNAHLSSHFFDEIDLYTGVDMSSALLTIANKYFKTNKTEYIESDIINFLSCSPNTKHYTKILFCGSMQYFSPEMIDVILQLIKERFNNLEKMLITPIPDREKANAFFAGVHGVRQDIDDHRTSIGRFYSVLEMEELANRNGFTIQYLPLNGKAHNAHYRYGILLTPKKRLL